MTYDPRRENLFDQSKTQVQLGAGTPFPTRDDRDDIVRELCEALEPLATICNAQEELFSGHLSARAHVLVPIADLRRANAALRRARGPQ